jgi:hypothetical protein
MSVLRRPFRAAGAPPQSGERRLFFTALFHAALFLLPAQEAPRPDPPPEMDMEAVRRVENEAAAELVSLRLGDSEVSLQMSGYWKGSLSGSFGLALTPLGASAAAADSPVLFRQEADLTLSLWLQKRWFVEANFLDDYDLNTYRAGYRGLAGETVQYAGVGNAGLDFPVFPYLDLGGDSPASFGAYGRFGGGPLILHALVRYDLAALEERIFVGNRERTFSYVPLNQPLRGRSFVLPDANLDAPPVVYLEDDEGELRDQRGRRWRAAAPGEFAAGAAGGLVELGAAPAGAVAAAYSKGGANRPWTASLGNYGTASTPGSGFLGEAQDWFGPEFSLKDYPQPGGETAGAEKPGAITLSNGDAALVIYEPGAFSPFERMSRYTAASNNASAAALVRLSTGERISEYELLPLEDGAVSPDIPLYAASDIRRGVYELAGALPLDQRSPQTRWPLGKSDPRVYLPGSGPFTGDMGVRFTNYGGPGAYNIGVDVVPGSVQVWRSGLADPRIVYDAASGQVALESPAGFNEVIRITYLKRGGEQRAGSLAAGLGAQYRPGGPFSSDLALGVRWNFADESYAESGALSPGTVGLGAKAAWDFDRLQARITGGLGFEQPDTTGLYRAAGMEGNEIVLALPAEDSFISEAPGDSAASLFGGLTLDNRSDLTYRNYRETGILGNLMPLDWDGAAVVPGQKGPYPVRDPGLTTQTHVLAAEFTLEGGKTWAGFEVPLGGDGALMEEAGEIEVPFRFYGFNAAPPAGFSLILQIGALADKDRGGAENPGLIVERELYRNSGPANFHQAPQKITLALSAGDRRKLRGAAYLRIIAVRTGGGAEEIRGRVLLAPPIVRGASFRPVVVEGAALAGASGSGGVNEVRTLERIETGGSRLEDAYGGVIGRLHGENQRQRVLEVSWKRMAPGVSAGTDGRISALPLSSYRKFVFFVKGPTPDGGADSFDGGTLRAVLGRGPESLARPGEIDLDAEIPLSAFRPGAWSRVEIAYRGDKKILVDGRTIAGARLSYRSRDEETYGEAGSSGYAAVFVSPGGLSAALPDGAFLLDELLLEDPSPAWRLNGGGGVDWKRPGPVLSAGGRTLAEDLSLSAALESGVRGDPFSPEPESSGGVISRSAGEITVLGTRVRGNAAFTALDGAFYWSGGHGLSRSWGPFSVETSYSAAPEDKNMAHSLGLGLSGAVSSRLNGEVYYEDEKLERKWNWSLGFSPPLNAVPALSLEASAVWTEDAPAGEWLENYGKAWVQSWKPLAPDLGPGAAKRETRGFFRITENTKPLGAELSLEGTTAFSRTAGRTQSTNLVRLDIPVVIGSGGLNVRGERNYKRQLRFSGRDALEDGAKFGESIRETLPLWGVFPLYSLFSPDLEKALDRGLENSPSADRGEYAAFTDQFSLDLRLPGVYGLRALFTPAAAGLRISRILERKLDTPLDLLNLGGNLGFSAVNMFGAFGVFPVFSFYQGDEFTHSLESSVALPRGEAPSWRFQSSFNGAFHGFSGAELGFTNTLTAGSSGWLESFILDWTAPTRKSVLSLFYNWIAAAAGTQDSWLALSNLMNAGYEQFRKESLELAFDHADDYLHWTVTLGHESIIRILGRLYFSVFAKLHCARDEEARSLSFTGTAGSTLNVSF